MRIQREREKERERPETGGGAELGREQIGSGKKDEAKELLLTGNPHSRLGGPLP